MPAAFGPDWRPPLSTPDRALRAAAFLTEVLELDLDPVAIAEDLVIVNDEVGVTTYAAELEASFGPAAFLIYVYDLAPHDGGGAIRDRYESDIATLQTAAERDAPGPRLLANGEGDAEAFLLATTPATFRLLAGEAFAPDTEPPIMLHPDADAAALRRDAATELLTHLRAANLAAGTWLAALQADGGGADENDEETIEFNEEETELALYLLDDRGIQNVLRAINLFITAARSAAEQGS